jgi:hypothetical protein
MRRHVDVDFKLGQNIFGHGEPLGELLVENIDRNVPVAEDRGFGQLQIGGEDTSRGEGAGPLLDAVTFAVLKESKRVRPANHYYVDVTL